MKLHNKKSFILTITVIFTISMLSSVFAFAATESDLRSNLDDVESAQDELSKQMSQLSKDIKSLQSDVDPKDIPKRYRSVGNAQKRA